MPAALRLRALALLVALAATSAHAGPPAGTGNLAEGRLSSRLRPPAAKSKKLTKREERARRAFRYGNFLILVEKDYAGAAAELEKALKLDRKHGPTLLALAAAYEKLGEWNKSAKTLAAAAKRARRDKTLWRALGRAYHRAGQTKDALAAYRTALTIDGRYAPALLESADIQYAGDKSKETHEKALKLYERYLEATPTARGLDTARVERLVAQARHGAAAAAFIDARQEYEAAFRARSGMHGHLENAYSKLEAVLREKPGHAPALHYQGLIHQSVKSKSLHDVDKAIAKFEAAGSYAPALTELGRFHRKLDELKKAAEALKKAAAADALYGEAYYELGIVHNLDGRREEAVLAFRKAVDLNVRSFAASKAVVELSRLAPKDPRVLAHYRQSGRFKADVFNTEKFKGSIQLLEKRLGGVDEAAPEQIWLDEMMRRLLAAADKPDGLFAVKVVKTRTINAFAVPNGNIYVTRGFLTLIGEAFPEQPMSAENAAIAAVIGHEIVHVLKEHVIRSFVFREAMNTGRFTPNVLVSVTRTHEIEADREGMRMMFLAGYEPRMAVELHEAYAKRLGEIPGGLDHPTFDERIHYLEEYWSNEMAFAYASFHQGVEHIREATKVEQKELNRAAALYRDAIEDLKRFASKFARTPEALNNLALANAKLGLFALARSDQQSAMTRWYTEFSVEPKLALKFKPLARKRRTRSGGAKAESALPAPLRQARVYLEQALKKSPKYARARLNLAVVLLASGHFAQSEAELARLLEDCADTPCPVSEAQVLNLSGVVRAEQGRIEEAVKSFEASIRSQQEGELPPRIFNLAVALDKAERKADAIDAYQRFLSTVGEQAEPSAWAERARAALAKLKE